MSATRTLYLLRHCEAEEQYHDRFRGGKLDCHLSERGKVDSLCRAEMLKKKKISLVITTGLERTDFVGRRLHQSGVEHIQEALFREIDFGFWDGKTEEEAEKEFPEEYAEYRECWKERRGEDIVIPGGETMKDVLERVSRGWSNVFPLDRSTAIVGHSISTTCLLSHILKKPIRDIPYTELGGMHELEVANKSIVLIRSYASDEFAT